MENDETLKELKNELTELKGLLIVILAHMEEQCRCFNELYDYLNDPCDYDSIFPEYPSEFKSN